MSYDYTEDHKTTVTTDSMLVCSVARLVRFWSMEERAPQAVSSLSNGLCCAFSAEGSVLAAGTRDGSVHFWECPHSIASLQHMCRMALRRVMTTQQVEAMAIPTPLCDYLTYKVI
ncbi:hypothetical protein L3Q82_005157 [Scortum barcoo]|uniref:Uncharacterized protein n=1 Tax=Scortum barcoo TaxID=214431 RepID=A0ACB8VEN3_9TELE|nr:hypothetical protein L3Q82_005157 [Scortum barcoo]